MKVTVALELTLNIVLMEYKSCDIHFKMTGDIFDNESRYETVIFPIIRRVIGKTPGAVDYVPEILNMAKKYYNTTLSRGIYEEDERCVIYFYNNILPAWSNYHRDNEYKNYDEFKVGCYTRHVERCRQRGVDIQPFDVFKFVDWEVEYCAALAEKIEREIKEHINKLENETS